MKFIGPNQGAMACGEFGFGRMAEPAEIFDAIRNVRARNSRTAFWPESRCSSPPGRPEPIDPVRVFTNRSPASRATPSPGPATRWGPECALSRSGPSLARGRAGSHVETRAGDDGGGPRRPALRRRRRRRRGGGLARRTGSSEKIKKGEKGPPTVDLVGKSRHTGRISRPGPGAPRPGGGLRRRNRKSSNTRGQSWRARAATGSSPMT